MSFTTAVTNVLSNYANFQGRAPRSEYWYWVLFYVIIAILGGIVFGIISAITGTRFFVNLFNGLLTLFMLVPSIAVAVRRLHDLNKSGWWYLLVLLPLVGPIVLLVWFCTPGTMGPNQFGGAALRADGPMPMPVGYN